MRDPMLDLRDDFLDMFEAEVMSPVEIAAAFMDAFERYAHHKGHECERAGRALGAGRAQKKKRTQPKKDDELQQLRKMLNLPDNRPERPDDSH
jgi:hypothetical protein